MTLDEFLGVLSEAYRMCSRDAPMKDLFLVVDKDGRVVRPGGEDAKVATNKWWKGKA